MEEEIKVLNEGTDEVCTICNNAELSTEAWESTTCSYLQNNAISLSRSLFLFFFFFFFFSFYTVKANMLLRSAEKDASRTTYEVIWKNFTRFVRRVWQAVFIQFPLKFGCGCILCMSSIEHLLCILYMYIYMHNIYIMYGVTVCCLHAVLWIAIPGQRFFFFFFACLQSSTCVSRVSMTKCEVFSFIFTELSFYYFGSIFF